MHSDISEINPHLGLWQSENYESPDERAYYRWVHKVEKALGHSIDGNEGLDGYSLDTASDYFDAGLTVDEYIAEVHDRQAEITAAFGPLTSGATA